MRRATGEGSVSRHRSLAVRFRYLLLGSTIFGATLILMTSSRNKYIIFIDRKSPDGIKTLRYDTINSKQSHTIKTEGCSIPAIKPFDASILKFVEYPYGLKPCLNSSHVLLGHDTSKIWVIKKNLVTFNVSKEDKSLSCCYQAFYRPTIIQDITSNSLDHRVQYDDCVYFDEAINVQDEFVRVECFTDTAKIYVQYFLFAPMKKFMMHDDRNQRSKNEPAYNVLVLGIDGVSRLNLHRTMPKTINFLKNKYAVEMMGFNKVGDNTFPNVIPMLMGLKDDELKKVCLPHRKASFDNCPFIWEWYKQAGYYTAFGEDSSYLATFNYFKAGFANTPTDYYIHTFINEAEQDIGSNKDFNSYLCMQDTYVFKILLDYIENLTTTLISTKLFGFFWEITMSHDYLNYPMVMDDDYEQFFTNLDESNYLNDTIVFFVSDHGIRWGEIRSTKQGRLEERLPFLFVLTPQSFRDNYTRAYEHLKLNSKHLTTPFDLYATLADLVDLRTISDNSLQIRSNTYYSQDRGISLFLPVPYNRTCKSAEIEDHWCTCRDNVAVSKESPKAHEIAVHLVSLLNELLEQSPQCARLTLSEVLDIMLLLAGKPIDGVASWEEVMVVVRTMPGGAIFEATLRIHNDVWTLVGTVSRLNLYGEQSNCVNDNQLKLYCYCEYQHSEDHDKSSTISTQMRRRIRPLGSDTKELKTNEYKIVRNVPA